MRAIDCRGRSIYPHSHLSQRQCLGTTHQYLSDLHSQLEGGRSTAYTKDIHCTTLIKHSIQTILVHTPSSTHGTCWNIPTTYLSSPISHPLSLNVSTLPGLNEKSLCPPLVSLCRSILPFTPASVRNILDDVPDSLEDPVRTVTL